jgi:hypothetical protein
VTISKKLSDHKTWAPLTNLPGRALPLTSHTYLLLHFVWVCTALWQLELQPFFGMCQAGKCFHPPPSLCLHKTKYRWQQPFRASCINICTALQPHSMRLYA